MNKQFNFSKPEVINSNEKKQFILSSIVEKIGAIIGLVQLGANMSTPDKVKTMLTPKQRDQVIRIIIFSIIWFAALGIFETFNLIIQIIKYFL